MDDWQKFFEESKIRRKLPEVAIGKFVFLLEDIFEERPLNIWDLCCGAGRHSLEAARRGFAVYASDGSDAALELTRQILNESKLPIRLEKADMTNCPWPDLKFHGVMSWDALHHNRLTNIVKAINLIYERLYPGGLFIGTLKSTKADSYGHGRRIEPDTYIADEGNERGIPHHYFDEQSICQLFGKWEIISLAEQVVRYIHRGEDFYYHNPFGYTRWEILARKGDNK